MPKDSIHSGTGVVFPLCCSYLKIKCFLGDGPRLAIAFLLGEQIQTPAPKRLAVAAPLLEDFHHGILDSFLECRVTG